MIPEENKENDLNNENTTLAGGESTCGGLTENTLYDEQTVVWAYAHPYYCSKCNHRLVVRMPNDSSSVLSTKHSHALRKIEALPAIVLPVVDGSSSTAGSYYSPAVLPTVSSSRSPRRDNLLTSPILSALTSAQKPSGVTCAAEATD